MTNETQTPEAVTSLTENRKAFIGNMLATSGMVFLLAGVTFFIALLCALFLKRDILTALVIGSLVTGIASFSAGLSFLSKKTK